MTLARSPEMFLAFELAYGLDAKRSDAADFINNPVATPIELEEWWVEYWIWRFEGNYDLPEAENALNAGMTSHMVLMAMTKLKRRALTEQEFEKIVS